MSSFVSKCSLRKFRQGWSWRSFIVDDDQLKVIVEIDPTKTLQRIANEHNVEPFRYRSPLRESWHGEKTRPVDAARDE